MKKAISLFLVSLMAVSLISMSACSTEDRENDVLKVYNAGDYIALKEDDVDGAVESFEKYYRNLTNNPNFKVIYDTFDNNETAITKIEKNKEDWDLVGVSDYAVQKLKDSGLLKKIDTTKLENFDKISPYVRQQFQTVSGLSGDETYAVGYMWGTMGILYNVSSEGIDRDVESWSALWSDKYYNKVLMKNSVRDSYAVALLYANSEELLGLSGEEKLARVTELLQQADSTTIAQAEKVLTDQKKAVNVRYELDDGKNDIVLGTYHLSLAWSGDAGYAISSALEADNGVELDYFIPLEGSNVWFDGWTMPIYSKNEKAALAFIDYMNNPEIAIANMEYTGYTSVVATKETLEWHASVAEESGRAVSINAHYFFGDIDGYDTTALMIDPVYIADENEIARCGIMKDFGDETENVLAMFTRVKGDTIPAYVYIIIGVIIAGGIGAAVYFTMKAKMRKKSKRPASRKRA